MIKQNALRPILYKFQNQLQYVSPSNLKYITYKIHPIINTNKLTKVNLYTIRITAVTV